jgi:hypothetical protein
MLYYMTWSTSVQRCAETSTKQVNERGRKNKNKRVARWQPHTESYHGICPSSTPQEFSSIYRGSCIVVVLVVVLYDVYSSSAPSGKIKPRTGDSILMCSSRINVFFLLFHLVCVCVCIQQLSFALSLMFECVYFPCQIRSPWRPTRNSWNNSCRLLACLDMYWLLD